MLAIEDPIFSKKIFQLGKDAQNNAYCPYSKFKVASVIVTKDNQVFSGCNVENASYSLTICAERSAIVQMITAGKTYIKEIYLFSNSSKFISPCGACRQMIAEFSDPSTKVILLNQEHHMQVFTASELLPLTFELETSNTQA